MEQLIITKLYRIELSGSPSTGVGKSHSQGTMQNSSTNYCVVET